MQRSLVETYRQMTDLKGVPRPSKLRMEMRSQKFNGLFTRLNPCSLRTCV